MVRVLQILVIEGLHPFYDDRVADLLDFKIYLDISDDVKFAWKLQRDMTERGHSEESIRQSIEARKPDFDAYIDPQKEKADVIIQVPAVPNRIFLGIRLADCNWLKDECSCDTFNCEAWQGVWRPPVSGTDTMT